MNLAADPDAADPECGLPIRAAFKIWCAEKIELPWGLFSFSNIAQTGFGSISESCPTRCVRLLH